MRFLFSVDMESAIQTLVTTFLSSTRGKENMDGKSFQKMVKKHLGSVMEVKTIHSSSKALTFPSLTILPALSG